MNKHFDYLLEESNHAFFQKAAEAIAGAPPAAMTKTAAVRAKDPVEKLAHELVLHLNIARNAGPIGVSMGMTKRAFASLERMGGERVLPEKHQVEAFQKVASEAIAVDLTAALEQILEVTPAEKRAYVEREVAIVGRELAKAAIDESVKLANWLTSGAKGLGKAIGGAGEAVGALRSTAKGIGGAGMAAAERLGEKGVGAVEHVGGAIKKPFSEAAAGFRAGKAEGAAKRLSGLENEMKATREATLHAPAGSVGKGFHEGALKDLESQHAAQKAKVDKLPKPAAPATETKPAETPKPIEAKPATVSAATTAPKTPEVKTPASPETKHKGDTAEDAADKAKGATSTPDAETKKIEVKPEQAGEFNEEGAAGGLKDTFHKFRKGHKLNRAERRQLMMAGGAGLVGSRVVSGRDVITGDKND